MYSVRIVLALVIGCFSAGCGSPLAPGTSATGDRGLDTTQREKPRGCWSEQACVAVVWKLLSHVPVAPRRAGLPGHIRVTGTYISGWTNLTNENISVERYSFLFRDADGFEIAQTGRVGQELQLPPGEVVADTGTFTFRIDNVSAANMIRQLTVRARFAAP